MSEQQEEPMTTTAPVADIPAPRQAPSPIKRFAPLAVIAVALIAFFVFDLDRYFTLDALREYRGDLRAFATANPLLAPIGMAALYAALVAISFPGAGFLTIFCGFMFGTVLGGTTVVFGATIGATLIFLAARTALGDSLKKKAGPWMEKFEKGFREGEFSYLLIMRLVPAFPFFIVNLVPAFLGAKLRNYVITTAFGIMPATFVYASVGAGAGAVLDAGEELQLAGLLTKPEIIGPLAGLVVVALILPRLVKRFAKPSQLEEGTAG